MTPVPSATLSFSEPCLSTSRSRSVSSELRGFNRSFQSTIVGDMGLRKTTRLTRCGYIVVYFSATALPHDKPMMPILSRPNFFRNSSTSCTKSSIRSLLGSEMIPERPAPRSSNMPALRQRLQVVAANVDRAPRPTVKKYNRIVIASSDAIKKTHPPCTLEISFGGRQIVVGGNG